MKCPYCGRGEIYVIDSRPIERNGRRRRYRCYSCDQRFTTHEYVIGEHDKRIQAEIASKAKKQFASELVEYINELSRKS